MKTRTDLIPLIIKAFEKEALKKLVFSRPEKSEITKASARLCSHRGRRILAIEYSLPGNTVSQKNVPEAELKEALTGLLSEYKQANLLTTLGDAEWKISKSGKEIILGGDALLAKLNGASPAFESAIEALDKKKNYILSGSEDFLIKPSTLTLTMKVAVTTLTILRSVTPLTVTGLLTATSTLLLLHLVVRLIAVLAVG